MQEDLPIHIEDIEIQDTSFEDNYSDIEDIIDEQLDIKEDLNIHLENYRNALESLTILEDYHSLIYKKETIGLEDLQQFNLITKAIKINLDTKDYDLAIEDLSDTLDKVKSAASTTYNIAKTGASVVGTVANKATHLALSTVLKAADLSAKLISKINEGINYIASQSDIITGLIEKRWFGIKRLLDIYDLQINKLEDDLNNATKNSNNLTADIKIKLNILMLDYGRRVTDKNSYLKIIEDDITDLCSFINTYTNSIKNIEYMISDTNKSLALLKPYKHTLVQNFNVFNNDILSKLAEENIFKESSKEEGELRSRVLISNKRINLNYLENKIRLDSKRSEIREAISKLYISSSKVKSSDNRHVKMIELKDFSVKEAFKLLDLLKECNFTLQKYYEEKIPRLTENRYIFTRINAVMKDLSQSAKTFTLAKSFISNQENLETFKSTIPGKLSDVLSLFIQASSFTTLVGLIGINKAIQFIDYFRKFFMSSIFTTLDLQYKITKLMNNVDGSVLDTLVSVRGQCFRVVKRLSKSNIWV